MKPTIEIVVSPTGAFTIEGVGFKGVECEQATKFLEAALGVVSTTTKKPEFYQRVTTAQNQTLGS